MKLSSQDVKSFARKIGVDLVGIAPIERFEGVPPWMHPASVFPEGMSVIMMARQITRGSLRGIEEGTHWVKPSLGLNARIPYDLGRFLEDHGWEAVPVYQLAPERWPEGIPVSPDRPAPNVTPSFEYAAVAAGLGEMGYCKIFLTPEFGPRQQLGMLVTDVPLEPDPLFEGKICDSSECLECVRACPLNVISEKEVEEIVVAGKKTTYAKIDFRACRKCPNGAFPNRSDPERGEPNRLAASCVRACIAHLEETGKLKKKFHQPFRKRKPWSLKY